MKKCVLIFADYYIPSVKAGGPVQSIKNLVDNLSNKVDFYIVTGDRDIGDKEPFENIKVDEWIRRGDSNVLYTDISTLTWRKTANIINNINYDVVYLNSFFSYKFSIVPLLLSKTNQISKKPIIIAPRGQFSKGALGLKNRKKKFYLRVMKAFGLYNNIIWHATAAPEEKDIKVVFDNAKKIIVANNLTKNYQELKNTKKIEKVKGKLEIIFISRVHPKKNLKKAIEFLNEVNGEIIFNIYGPIEDELYWSECERTIACLPKNIIVSYKGILDNDNVINIFKSHHVFLFPTLGENYGHVISEALIGGCPVIISDQTPWRDLEELQVGWDINLTNEKKFIEVLQNLVNMDSKNYDEISKKAFEFGKQKSNKKVDIEKNYNLFQTL
jgi:glycosyltransferase involved in cell wall biosynthesis